MKKHKQSILIILLMVAVMGGGGINSIVIKIIPLRTIHMPVKYNRHFRFLWTRSIRQRQDNLCCY